MGEEKKEIQVNGGKEEKERMVILDTNIFIDHLRQRGKARSILDGLMETHSKEELSLSVITVQELYEGKSMADKSEEDYALAMISPLTILSYSFEVAQKAGEIARFRNYFEFEDVAIAATAVVNNCKLLTINKKHFQGIKGLEFL